MKKLDLLIGALLIIGGLNWGLVGIFNFDLVAALFGSMSMITRIVYGLVGLAALYEIVGVKWIFHRWNISLFKPHTQA